MSWATMAVRVIKSVEVYDHDVTPAVTYRVGNRTLIITDESPFLAPLMADLSLMPGVYEALAEQAQEVGDREASLASEGRLGTVITVIDHPVLDSTPQAVPVLWIIPANV